MKLSTAACIFVVVVLTITSPAPVISNAPLAILLSCDGDVKVLKAGGESTRGSFGMHLAAGDEVRTGENSYAEIFFSNGNMVGVGAASSARVSGAKEAGAVSTSEESAKNFKTVQNFLKLKDSEGTSSLALRSADKNSELRCSTPSQTKILDSEPTFRWESTDPSKKLRFTIYNEKGVHWTKDVEGTDSLDYPPDAPALAPGTAYSWTVETADPLLFPPVRSTASYFEVLSAGEKESFEAALNKVEHELQSNERSLYLVRASMYFNSGLMENAIQETKKALEADPKNPSLHAILARLYTEVGKTKEALQEYNWLLEKQ